MPQLPDYSDLSAEAGELIEGQYADRPQLRPILDAVLALLPALGPATVQARRTIVSLVCPRRTFAVVRATTKDRVDLGLRIVPEPGNPRFQPTDPARSNDMQTTVALATPQDVDAGRRKPGLCAFWGQARLKRSTVNAAARPFS